MIRYVREAKTEGENDQIEGVLVGGYDLVTFGEMLIRMAAPNYQRIEQVDSFDAHVTGAEMNACVTATRLGLRTAHVTRLPQNPLGRMVVNKIREHGIDTRHTVWSEDGRVGLFFLEFGAMPRTNAVLYDRKNSAMSKILPGEVDWDTVLAGAKLLHVSGTAPALSESTAEATKEAVVKARENEVKVVFDLNYRAKLWSEEQAENTMSALMEYCDVLITTEEDTYRVFKIKEDNYERAAEKLHERFNFDVVVITLRENITVWRNNWTAIAYSDGRFYDDVLYELEVVDRVGGGDAFTGGFLYAYLTYGRDIKKSLQYGNAACALKHSIPGDLNWTTLEEVENLIARGPGGGMGLRVSR